MEDNPESWWEQR